MAGDQPDHPCIKNCQIHNSITKVNWFFYSWSLQKELNTGRGTGGSLCWGQAQPQVPPLCPARATLSGTWCHRCHPAQLGCTRFVPKAGWGPGMAPALSTPTVPGMASRGQSHHTHSHLLPTPVVTRPCWPFRMSPVGTRATGPSNRGDGGQGEGALCHGDLLIKPGFLGWVFQSPNGSGWLQVTACHGVMAVGGLRTCCTHHSMG